MKFPEGKVKEAIAEALEDWEYVPCDTTDMVNDIYSRVRGALIEYMDGEG